MVTFRRNPVDAAAELQNAVHEALVLESSDELALLRRLANLGNTYGDDAVSGAVIDCARIAYLRLRFKTQR